MSSNRSTSLRIFSSPHGIAVLAFVIAYLTCALYLYPYSLRDPSSAFFNPDKGFERGYSIQRERQADAYVQRFQTSQPYTTTAANHTLCIGIPTVQREGARYLQITVGSLLDGLTAQERSEIILLPLIAQTDPQKHNAFNASWSHSLVDRLVTYDLDPATAAHIQYLEVADLQHQEKSRFDYLYALNACYDTGVPYILMLEDDVLAVRGWYPRLRSAFSALERRRSSAGLADTLYIRLFFTEIFLGWNSEDWPRYLAASVAFEFALAGILLTLRRRRPGKPSSATARFLSRSTVFAILFLASPACVGLYFAAGRMTVQPFSPGLHVMNAFGCCSQALLFPRARVPGLTEYIESLSIGAIDSVIEQYANRDGWTRLALTPALFQHNGGRSSKSKGIDAMGLWGRRRAEVLWNFRFERYAFDPSES